MTFTWNNQKNQENIRKHGISFETAKLIFGDPFRIELFDTSHSDEEERFIAIGYVLDVPLLVVYTEKEDEVRIISARKAMRSEVEKYYYGIQR